MRDRIRHIVLFLFFLLLPTQLGTFFFFSDSYVNGLRIDYLAPALYLTDCIFLVLALLYAKALWNVFKEKRTLGVVAVFLFSSLFALSPILGLYKTIKLLEWIGIAAICAFESRKDAAGLARVLVPAFTIGSVFQVVLSVLQIQNQATLQGIFYWFGERALTITTPEVARSSLAGKLFLRPYGTFSHPNSLGGFYLLSYLFLYFWPPAKSAPRARALFLFSATILVFLSFSKAVIFTFLAINMLLFFQFFAAKQCKICGVARILLVGVLAYIFSSAQGDPLSVEKRVLLVDHAFRIIQTFPLLGTGPGSYLIAEGSFPAAYTTFFLQPVHNIVLLATGELGLVGIGAVLALLFKPFVELAQSRAFRYCFAAVLLTGMVDHYWLTLQQNFLLIAVVAGALIPAFQKKPS